MQARNLSLICALLCLALLAPGVVGAQSVAGNIRVAGRVDNGTAGAKLPLGLAVTLYALEGATQTAVGQTQVDTQGHFVFPQVATTPQRVFQVKADVAGVTYLSQAAVPQAGEAQLDLPLTVYEVTADPGKLRITLASTFLQFLNASQMEAMVLYTIANDGDRTVQGSAHAPDGRAAAMRFSLPPSATRVQFQSDAQGKRFVTTPAGFLDTAPVVPGQQAAQVLVSFVLPYADAAHVEQQFYYPADSLVVNLAESGVTLGSAQLKDDGTRDSGSAIRSRVYSGGTLAAGQALVFDLRGKPDPSAVRLMGMPPPAQDTRWRVLAGGWALGLALLLAGLLWRRLSRLHLRTIAAAEQADPA